MLKRKVPNRIVILLGVILIILGIYLLGYDYFKAKKDKVYEEMSFSLSGIPEEIITEEETPDEDLSDDEEVIENIERPNDNLTTLTPQVNYNYIGYLEIPKISLKKGFVAINSKYNNVNRNIAIMEGSNYPNVDNSILTFAAHNGTCWNCYFKNLNKVTIGDKAYIYYNNVKYMYTFTNIYEVKKTGSVAIHRNPNKTSLALVTCTWGTKDKQTIFIAELTSKENM